MRQAEQLSGFSRGQLRLLDSAGLVVALKHPAILYSWNQILFLKVLLCFRERFTYKQIQSFLESMNKQDLENIIQDLPTFILGLLVETPQKTSLQFFKAIDILEDVSPEIFQAVKECEPLTESQALALSFYLTKDYIGSGVVFHFNKKIILHVGFLKKQLVSVAKELNIKDLDLKLPAGQE